MLVAIFSILLGAMSIGPRNGLFEDRAEAEVRDGIFEVGIQSLEGSHVRVRNVFHREGDSLFPLAKGSHRMPELIAVKNDQIPRFPLSSGAQSSC